MYDHSKENFLDAINLDKETVMQCEKTLREAITSTETASEAVEAVEKSDVDRKMLCVIATTSVIQIIKMKESMQALEKLLALKEMVDEMTAEE